MAPATAQQDLRTIIALVLLVVLGILMMLLRSIIAPVLLDTFLVRSLLVPALTYDLGPKAWRPSRLSRPGEGDGGRGVGG